MLPIRQSPTVIVAGLYGLDAHTGEQTPQIIQRDVIEQNILAGAQGGFRNENAVSFTTRTAKRTDDVTSCEKPRYIDCRAEILVRDRQYAHGQIFLVDARGETANDGRPMSP